MELIVIVDDFGRVSYFDGWHLPSVDEWKKLVTNVDPDLGGVYDDDNVAGKALKDTTTAWKENGQGTNTSGFSALPAGYFHKKNGEYDLRDDGFFEEGFYTYFWSATQSNGSSKSEANCMFLLYDSDALAVDYQISKNAGLSVRCIKDK